MADPKVVSIVPGGPHKPDPDVLAVCRALMKRALAGELLAVAVAVDTRDGTEVATAFADGAHGTSLLGALRVVERRVMRVVDHEEG